MAQRARELLAEETGGYARHSPWPKQQTFLDLDCLEALYGGAAGGGKSDALLMAALQYVHVPNYHALLLRRTFPQLYGQGDGLIPHSKEWLTGSDAKWSEQNKTWTFPSGATVAFSHLDHEDDKYRFQGPSFQFVGFDELTHFTETQYSYLFSRLRKLVGTNVPVRMRAASNPGGIGHEWVKRRFLSDECLNVDAETRFATVWENHGRFFVPARLEDNPALDIEQYELSMAELDPVLRAQLRHGDWAEFEGGRFRKSWFRYYDRQGDYYRLLDPSTNKPLWLYRPEQLWRFLTCDFANTTDSASDYTVICAWSVSPKYDLILLDCVRGRIDVDRIVPTLCLVYQKHNALWAGIEETNQQALISLAQKEGIAVRRLKPAGKKKLERAQTAIVRYEAGQVWHPAQRPSWLPDYEAELLAFTGDDKVDAHDDQVDCAAYAAIEVAKQLTAQRGKPSWSGGRTRY